MSVSTDYTIVERTCISCKVTYQLNIKSEDISKLKSGGGYIQDILHYLTSDERELMISQICGKCFDLLFQDWD